MTTNWDRYLKQALKDDDARQRVDRAGLAWDIALQISALRERRGLTQSQLAELMGTRQANVSRLESGDYRGYTLQTLDRVARALGARLEITLTAAAKDVIGEGQPFPTMGVSQPSSAVPALEVRPRGDGSKSLSSTGIESSVPSGARALRRNRSADEAPAPESRSRARRVLGG